MDGSEQQGQQSQQSVEQQVAEIKRDMPSVYEAIQAKASEIGREAYSLVRRGLRGEPDCFWAMEAGRVVGTPIKSTSIMADVAQQIVRFTPRSVVVWAVKSAVTTGKEA